MVDAHERVNRNIVSSKENLRVVSAYNGWCA